MSWCGWKRSKVSKPRQESHFAIIMTIFHKLLPLLSTLVFAEHFNMAPKGSLQTWQPFPICQEQEGGVLKKMRSSPFRCRNKGVAGRHSWEQAMWGPNGSRQLRYRSYHSSVGAASLPTCGCVFAAAAMSDEATLISRRRGLYSPLLWQGLLV